MALKQKFAVKCVLGDNDFQLRADPGEAFLVKDIQVYNPVSNYVTLRTEKATVGYFRVGGPLGSHLPFLGGRSEPRISDHIGAAVADHAAHNHKAGVFKGSDAGADQTLFVPLVDGAGTTIAANALGKSGAAADIDIMTDTLAAQVHSVSQPDRHSIESVPMLRMRTLLRDMIERALLTGYPVAEGETFSVTGAKQAGAIVLAIYEIYEPGDIKPEDPNGSRAKEYVFVQYGNSGAAINVDGDTLFDVCQTPPEFPDFPFGKTVSPKHSITLLSILGSDFSPSANIATDYTYTKFLKMVYNREVLFDEDRNGLLMLSPTGANIGGRDLVAEGQSLIGNYSNIDMRLPFILPEPLVFSPGDELLLYLTTGRVGTGQDINIDGQEVGLIEAVKGIE